MAEWKSHDRRSDIRKCDSCHTCLPGNFTETFSDVPDDTGFV